MKPAIRLWELRWFVALWVLAGVLIGMSLGVVLAERALDARASNADSWLFWGGVVLYAAVSATLGRRYLCLVRSLA